MIFRYSWQINEIEAYHIQRDEEDDNGEEKICGIKKYRTLTFVIYTTTVTIVIWLRPEYFRQN